MNKNLFLDKWQILEKIPNGWKIDKTCGSPIFNTVFITNSKSVLNGQERALLKINADVIDKCNKNNQIIEELKIKNETKKDFENAVFPTKKYNHFARLSMKERLLNDIMIDLAICEIEGWDKKEYIKELQDLLKGLL